jgi:hypothetical protein
MEINSESVLIDPDFHDGLLTGVILDRGTLELRLTDINEKSWSLIVPQILALSATNLLKANIVYEIEFFHKNKLTFEVGDSLDVSYFGENLKDVANAVAEGTLTVMRISTDRSRYSVDGATLRGANYVATIARLLSRPSHAMRISAIRHAAGASPRQTDRRFARPG